jgi:hypothetical protein
LIHKVWWILLHCTNPAMHKRITKRNIAANVGDQSYICVYLSVDSIRKGMLCVHVRERFKGWSTTKIDVEGLYRILVKFIISQNLRSLNVYNDLLWDSKLSLGHVINVLFYVLWKTAISVLATTMGNPVFIISTKAHCKCDRLVEDAYSSVAPDPTFVFVEASLCCPTHDRPFIRCIWMKWQK